MRLNLDNFPNLLEDKRSHAERLCCSGRSIDRWCDEPDGLPYTTRGGTRLFNPSWTKAWLESRRVQRNPTRRRRAV
jgi:hypothetical protein